MDLVAVIVACLVLLVCGVLEVRRASREAAPAPPGRAATARGLIHAAIAGLALSPVSASWLFAAGDHPLPVPRPVTSAGGAPWHFDFDLGGEFWLFVAGGFLLVRFAPVLVAFLVGRRRSAAGRPLPTGRRLLLAASVLTLVVALLAAGRAALGGAAPADFATYGALTPDDGAGGWRASRVIDGAIADGAALRTLDVGQPLDSDLEFDQGSDCCGALAAMPGWRERPGLKAWIADRPVLIERRSDGTLDVRLVADRSAQDVPPAGRPHFRTMPRWASGGAPHTYVLVEDRPGGARFAVRMDESGAVQAQVRDVAWLLAAPAWPLLGLLAALFVAIALSRRAAAGSAWGGPLRFGAAWLLLEATIAAALLYAPYV